MKLLEYKSGDVKVNIPFDENIYINATEVYQAFGKSHNGFSNWKGRTLIPYVERLAELNKTMSQNGTSAGYQDFIKVIKGGAPHEQGTWLHPKLAIVFARWLSMDFEIWCDEKITELLRNKKVEISTEEQISILDKFDFVYKAIKTESNWGRKLDMAVREIVNSKGVDVLESQKLLINKLSKKINFDDRVHVLDKVIRRYTHLLNDKSINEDMHNQMKLFLVGRIKHIQKSRLTKLQKEYELLSNAVIDDDLLDRYNELKDKFNAFISPSTNPPIDPDLLDLASATSIQDTISKLKVIKDVEIEYADYLQHPQYDDPIGKTGKRKPDFKTDPIKASKIQAAIWRNPDNSFLVWGTNLNRHDMGLIQLDSGFHYGLALPSIAVRYFAAFDEGNGYLLIYKHTPSINE